MHYQAIKAVLQVAMNPEKIEEWFRGLQVVIQRFQRHGIKNEDVWNINETGLQTGIGRDQWIITRLPK